MPGLPIDLESVSLMETVPGALDSLVDPEAGLDESSPGDVYRYDDGDNETLDEELHEMEPPGEDTLDDNDTPVIEVIGTDSDVNDDDDDDDDDESDTDEDGEDSNSQSEREEGKVETVTEKTGGVTSVTNLDAETVEDLDTRREAVGSVVEDNVDAVLERLQGDTMGEKEEEGEGSGGSSEVYVDALDTSDSDTVKQVENVGEDPGGTGNTQDRSQQQTVTNTDEDPSIGTSVDTPTDTSPDTKKDLQSNNNIEKEVQSTCDQVLDSSLSADPEEKRDDV